MSKMHRPDTAVNFPYTIVQFFSHSLPNMPAGGPLLRVATIRRTTDTFLFISHPMNILVFKFRCNIFIDVRIIKEIPGSISSGTHCINNQLDAIITIY